MKTPPRFKMIGFKPRSSIQEDADHVLEILTHRALSGSTCEASIVRDGHLFHFTITINMSGEILENKKTVDSRDPHCRERLWQVDVVYELARDLNRRITGWYERRSAA